MSSEGDAWDMLRHSEEEVEELRAAVDETRAERNDAAREVERLRRHIESLLDDVAFLRAEVADLAALERRDRRTLSDLREDVEAWKNAAILHSNDHTCTRKGTKCP